MKLNPYNIYESKQRKVFWKKIRSKVKKDLKKDQSCFGHWTFEFLTETIDIKKVWQQPIESRQRLHDIMINPDNISESDIIDIMREHGIEDKEEGVKLYHNRMRLILKLGEFQDAKKSS